MRRYLCTWSLCRIN